MKPKKILLINPVVREWAEPNCFPTGLGYIASTLRELTHHIVSVLDLNALRLDDEALVRELQRYDPDVVGLTGIITQYGEVKRIAKMCRDQCGQGVEIICGGPLATSVPELLLNNTEVDLCAMGEGEKTILRLFPSTFDSMRGREGVAVKTPTGPQVFPPVTTLPEGQLDLLPFPAYDLFPMYTYIRNPIGPYNKRKWIDGKGEAVVKSMNIIGSRGCPFSCCYCFHCYMGEGYRMREPSKIISEMEFLRSKYGVDYLHFNDDAFGAFGKNLINFSRQMKLSRKESGVVEGLTWSCTGRASLSEEAIRAVAGAGCVGLWLGLESGSPTMLRAMNKKSTVKQYERFIALVRKYLPFEDFTFIVGTPGETDETISESIKFCKDMGVVPSAVFFMTPYPGTPLFKDMANINLRAKYVFDTEPLFEEWVESLGEQGRVLACNCSGASDEKVYGWHQQFIEETGVKGI